MSFQEPLQSATAQKIETARQKKDKGDQAYKQGDTKGALMPYHEALMFLKGLDKNALESIGVGSSAPPPKDKDGKEIKEKTEVDELIEKIYANMSACHLKNENWKRVVATADQVLSKNETHYKVLYRKGKALGELGFHEKAVKILEVVKEKSPADAVAVDEAIAKFRKLDKESERAHKNKMRGFLNRPEKEKASAADA
ncbi:hypothetical protein DXG03_001668 [Asterophora parasitica]|uniref:TPR-like protein n=1 Tax=Asterophora parasitica TaxID=117018 RepID=A0A9P7GGK1_9AGAR|nr:hypothetical protein DXG03_001668 [Asterophora parasitica]